MFAQFFATVPQFVFLVGNITISFHLCICRHRKYFKYVKNLTDRIWNHGPEEDLSREGEMSGQGYSRQHKPRHIDLFIRLCII